MEKIGRVCILKSNGKLIEFQSGNAGLGILTQNAINGGYNKEDIEEKYVNDEEWNVIYEKQIKEPAVKNAENKEKLRKQKEQKVKQYLNFTDEQWEELKEALRD